MLPSDFFFYTKVFLYNIVDEKANPSSRLLDIITDLMEITVDFTVCMGIIIILLLKMFVILTEVV